MSAAIARYRPASNQPAIGRLDMRARAGQLTAWLPLLALLAAAFFAGPANAAIDLRVESRPVSDPIQAYVTVTDGAGNPVGGLTAGSFTLTLDGNPLTIQPSNFSLPPAQNSNQRVSVVFAMDYSGSTAGAPQVAMQDAVVSFINAMKPGDYAAIVKFSSASPSGASVVQAFTAIDGAAGTSMLVSAAMSPYPEGKTNLYDAVNVALGQFSAPPVALPVGPKAVIVISDGEDNASVATMNAAIDKASSNGIPLFAIAVGTATTNGQQVLQSIAARTGGAYLTAPTESAIAAAYVTMATLLSNGYLLSFASSITDCNQHTLSVTVPGQSPTETKFTRCDAAKPVPQPTSSGGGGGGGSLGFGSLALGLAALAARRRRRASIS